MAIGDRIVVSVEKIAAGGEGLASGEDGRKVFIPWTAPGDRAWVKITEEHGSWARAECLGLEEASPLRAEPRCPLFGRCGGCSLQHLSYEAQLTAREEILCGALKRLGGAETLPPLEIFPSEPWEYRSRVSLHAIRANRGARAGFKARHSGEIIPVEDCPAADPAIRELLAGGRLRPPPGKDRFTVYGRAKDGVLIAEEGASPALPSRGTVQLLDKTVRLDASFFFQSNAALLETVILRLREWGSITSGSVFNGNRASFPKEPSGSAKNQPVMADIYAGAGTFSLFLADLFPGGADLLEENPAALSLAKENLESAFPGSRIPFRFFARRDESWVKKGLLPYAFAVADPPRQGLSPGMARALIEAGPPVLAYVSCEPSSLARDLCILKKAYSLETLYLFDFYPQTAHIESMGIFFRRELDP